MLAEKYSIRLWNGCQVTTATTPASPAQPAARTMWGGMRALGVLAESAARSRMGSIDGGPNVGPRCLVGEEVPLCIVTNLKCRPRSINNRRQSLLRGRTWSLETWVGAGAVRKIIRLEEGSGDGTGGTDERKGAVLSPWLSQAELSTFSKSSRGLPRLIYLSYQFSFHTLGEDYHALIRRYQLNVGGLRIGVRREAQISAYSTGGGDSCVEGLPKSPR
ncbi:hypothetical protein H0H92_001552, partial [Tricholoma furcatifolium]